MKKIFLPLLMILTASAALADPPDEDVHRPYIPSRGQWYAQFDAGFNLTSLDGNDEVRGRILDPNGVGFEQATNFYQSASGLAPLLSASLGYDFDQHFGLALRADIDMRSADNSAHTLDTCRSGTLVMMMPVDKKYSLDVTYLSISALAKIRFDNLYFFLGPTISAPLSRKFSETNTLTDSTNPCVYFPTSLDSSRVISGSLTSSGNSLQRLSFKIGAGYMIPLTSKMSLVPQIAYDFGLSNVFKNPEINGLSNPGSTLAVRTAYPTVVNHDMRLSSLQATIGLRINL